MANKMRSRADLLELQRAMAGAICRPLTQRWKMQGEGHAVADELIKPNDRLKASERLEIYNRQYWFRLLDCLHDDYPGVRAILGERKFLKFSTAYLEAYPSDTFALRNLGNQLVQFLTDHPAWAGSRQQMILDVARFEWAQIEAFDALAHEPLTPDDILDAPPSRLRFRLQPYLSLLSLQYAVDDFFIALKQRDGLRSEASNAVEAPRAEKEKSQRPPLPKREKIHLAVHRFENTLYYKRLEPEAFAILTALGTGATLEKACAETIASSPRQGVDWSTLIRDWFQNWSELKWLCPT